MNVQEEALNRSDGDGTGKDIKPLRARGRATRHLKSPTPVRHSPADSHLQVVAHVVEDVVLANIDNLQEAAIPVHDRIQRHVLQLVVLDALLAAYAPMVTQQSQGTQATGKRRP
jgi:hypothetical protein